jgi:hypothetical protein
MALANTAPIDTLLRTWVASLTYADAQQATSEETAPTETPHTGITNPFRSLPFFATISIPRMAPMRSAG